MAYTILSEKYCEICGKRIITLHPTLWTYRVKKSVSEGYLWYCSWSCYRKAGELNGKPRKKPKQKRFDM